MASNPINFLRWYQTWWGVVLVGLIVVVVVIVLGLGSIIGYYTWKIKKGEGGEIARQLNRAVETTTTTISNVRKELETDDDPVLGNSKAPIVIVEFVDFKCPNCKIADPIIKKITQKYWSKIKVIARDFPAESLHPGASELAVLASCAHSQGKYWALQDILFANQDQIPAKLTEVDMKNLLGQAGVDLAQVQKCLSGSQVKTEINRDYATGFKYGVRGTPTFFINGQKIEGVISLEAWDKFLGGL